MDIRVVVVFSCVLLCQVTSALILEQTSKYPFQDPNLPWSDRVDNLVSLLSVQEIVGQTEAIYGQPSPAIPRLGIKPYVWITECLRGQESTNTTAFPQALGLSAAFSGPLIFNVSEAISYEVRAHWNLNVKAGKYVTDVGLNCYSPVINIMRHPLWGRNQETYGEDPYLAGALVQYYVRGLQGNHPRYVRASSGCKHFDVHGGPENIPVSRFSFDAKVSTRDWRMTFLPQFKMCVEAGTYNLMCSYNRINGVPACANKKLLTDIARGEWGFTGFVVSDEGAVGNIITFHKFLPNATATATACIKAGCNQELCTPTDRIYQSQIDALSQDLLTEREIRENVKPLFYTRMRLGEFDPVTLNPYNKVGSEVIQRAEHRELAIKAAAMSFVLLKNTGNILPLRTKYRKIAFVGPFANITDQLFGDYTSNILPQYTHTVYQGLSRLSAQSVLAPGCHVPACKQYNSSDVQSAVRASDLVIVSLGTGQSIEMEDRDRTSIDLPGQQLTLLQDVVKSAAGKPVVLLLFNAGPLDIGWAKASEGVSAILECFFPAQATGEALYGVLSGAVSPAGRLPCTWPTHTTQVGPITDYSMKGRTYRYYTEEPLYPFGYGLSYATFLYMDIDVQPQTVQAGQDVHVTCHVTNTGPVDAEEVVQIYISWSNTSVPVPKLQLVAFERALIKVREKRLFKFTISAERMSVWLNDDIGWGFLAGAMRVYAGGQQPNQATSSPSNVLQAAYSVLL